MKTCPNCGANNRDVARFCARCATPLTPLEPARPIVNQPSPPSPPAGGVSRQPTKPLTRPPTPVEPATAPAATTRASQAGVITKPLPNDEMQLPPPRVPRESAVTDQTVPLAHPRTSFAALPKGALLHDDRYEIQEIHAEGSKVNVYLARDSWPVRRCPNSDCGSLKASSDDSHCPECGIELGQVQPVYLTYLLREAADPAIFNTEGQLLERRLSHPGILLPKDHFVESRRAYLVTPEFNAPLVASLPAPQELPQVLDWGLQLARAMTYLHEQQISLQQVDRSRIAIEGGGRVARWTNLAGVKFIDPADQADIANDVHRLAQVLFYLATGMEEYAPTVSLPEPVKGLFDRALTSQGRVFQSAQEFSLALEEILAQVRRPHSVDLIVGRRSDVGQERQLNEDGLLTLVLNQVQESLSQPLGLFVVADGMGGHSAGEVATRLTLDAVRQKSVTELLSLTTQPPAYDQWIKDIASAANSAVFEHRRNAGTDMGNTLVMAFVTGDTAFIANVGDSRAYLINQRGISQITTDHSLVERLVATGKITAQQALTHQQRNVIYRTIGDKSRVETDVFTQQLSVGDYLLLCSDGLSGMVTDQDIFNIIRSSVSPQDACERLVEAANDAGGEDNITVVIVQVIAG